MKQTLIRYGAVAIVLAAIGGIWAYFSHKPTLKASVPASPTAVAVAPAVLQPIPQVVNAVGTLLAAHEVTIAPELSGVITAIAYQPGQRVKKGSVLFRLDDRSYRAKLQSSEAALRLARLDYHRARAIVASGAESREAVDQLRAEYLEAKAAVAEDKTSLSNTVIKAPFTGYTGVYDAGVGSYVEAGESLMGLTDRSSLQVDYDLPERFWGKVALGQKVIVSLIRSGRHAAAEGVVTYIAPRVNVATRTMELRAVIPNVSNRLTPGLFVHIQQQLGRPQKAVLVPQASLIPTITGSQVFVVRKGHAYAVNVVTGAASHGRVEIIKGLKSGVLVVTAGQLNLKNGSKVMRVKHT